MGKTSINQLSREPQYPFNSVTKITDVKMRQLRNWLERGAIKLDANDKRKNGKHRRFSEMDMFRIALISSLVSMGFSHIRASEIAESTNVKDKRLCIHFNGDAAATINIKQMVMRIKLKLDGQHLRYSQV